MNIVIAILISVAITAVSPIARAHGPMNIELPEIDVSSFPPIEQDIAALSEFGAKAKEAGKRLVERGDSVLAQAHAALLDDSGTYPRRLQLITILGEIAHPDSATALIHAIERLPNNRYIYQNTLLALSKLQPTDEIRAFVDDQLLRVKRDPLLQRSALNYYAKNPGNQAVRWIDQYALNNDANTEVRYAALYMAGMNGDTRIKQSVIDVLHDGVNETREKYLLIGLSYVVSSIDEFQKLISGMNLSDKNINLALALLTFRMMGDGNGKLDYAGKMLDSESTIHRRAAIDYLIKKEDAERLASKWHEGDTEVRSSIRRTGHEITRGPSGSASFAKIEKHDHNKQYWALIVFFVLVSIFTIALLKWHGRNA